MFALIYRRWHLQLLHLVLTVLAQTPSLRRILSSVPFHRPPLYTTVFIFFRDHFTSYHNVFAHWFIVPVFTTLIYKLVEKGEFISELQHFKMKSGRSSKCWLSKWWTDANTGPLSYRKAYLIVFWLLKKHKVKKQRRVLLNNSGMHDVSSCYFIALLLLLYQGLHCVLGICSYLHTPCTNLLILAES